MSKRLKIIIVIGVTIFAIVALIVSLVGSIKKDIALGFSVASSIVSCILSAVAIIYTCLSNEKLDEQLSRLTNLVKSLNQESINLDNKIKEVAGFYKDFSPDLKKKLDDYIENMNVEIKSMYEDL